MLSWLLRLRCLHGALCLVMCAAWWPYGAVRAEQQTAAQEQLDQAQSALKSARFELGERTLQALLAREDLTARERNDALELLAIVHVAARNEAKAQSTLRELLRRDPAHPRRVTDLGPAVDKAFARALHSPPQPAQVTVRGFVTRGREGAGELSVALESEASAVDTVHAFLTLDGLLWAHLVSEGRSDARVRFPLPNLAPFAGRVGVYLEARAPSGAVLGALADAHAPLALNAPAPAMPQPACTTVAKPLRKEWWVWATVGVVLSSLIAASVITAN